tara:strand:+ start:198 stop:572 length:375 start_codon:yes stop_codon:yes gene_type:complete
VLAHVPFITLKDVQWVVQPAGNAKTRKEGRKNVHAFARGTWLYGDDELQLVCDELIMRPRVKVRYNPYKHQGFTAVDSDGQQLGHITRSDYAKLGTQWIDDLETYLPVAFAYDYLRQDVTAVVS